MREGGD